MAILTVWHDGVCTQIPFAGTPRLDQVLESAGLLASRPCGGRGVCGKCAVALEGAVSEPNAAELQAGTRLSCQAVLLADAVVRLPHSSATEQIQLESIGSLQIGTPMEGRLGAAIDIGTTTMALKLCELKSGRILSSAACLNPQTSVAADVMGRIGAAVDGRLSHLQAQAQGAVESMLEQACQEAGRSSCEVDTLVLTGNTTMLYLLTGRDPEALSHAPFRADCLFGTETELLGRRAYLPPCMNAFVGADITCAVLASGMTGRKETALLCDIGTNGEIALWKDGTLYVTSTAAGPAFEGAGISCGCGSIRGAIDRVWIQDGVVQIHTIGEAPAVGICGSGLMDAVAAFLELERIDETGAVEENSLPLSGMVALLPRDIRAVQLAKAAIGAGIQTLLEAAGAHEEEVSAFYIAGGFGSHLNVASAAAIGLIPASLQDRVTVIGNGALAGALELMLDQKKLRNAERVAAASQHLNLGGNPIFNENYMEQMFFPKL